MTQEDDDDDGGAREDALDLLTWLRWMTARKERTEPMAHMMAVLTGAAAAMIARLAKDNPALLAEGRDLFIRGLDIGLEDIKAGRADADLRKTQGQDEEIPFD